MDASVSRRLWLSLLYNFYKLMHFLHQRMSAYYSIIWIRYPIVPNKHSLLVDRHPAEFRRSRESYRGQWWKWSMNQNPEISCMQILNLPVYSTKKAYLSRYDQNLQLLKCHFEGKNPDFRVNPENFHHWRFFCQFCPFFAYFEGNIALESAGSAFI